MENSRRIACFWLLLTSVVILTPLSTRSDQSSDWVFQQTDSNITIISYTGQAKAVTIPGTINGLPVVSLQNGSFVYCTNLVSVTIPESVTNIGYGAIYYCPKLTNIGIAEANLAYSSASGVLFNKDKTSLIRYPFGKLGAYSIPNSATNIEYKAFSDCGHLTSVTIGSELASLDNPFPSCTSLTNIAVDPLNANYSSAEGVLFDKSQSVLILCPAGKRGSYSIPDSVTNVWYGAFGYCANLTSITIGKGVTSLESGTQGPAAPPTIITPITPPIIQTNPPFIPLPPVIITNRPIIPVLPIVQTNPPVIPVWPIVETNWPIIPILPVVQTNLTPIPQGSGDHDSTAFATRKPMRVVTAVGGPGGLDANTGFAFNGCRNLTNITVDPLNPTYRSENGVLLNKSATSLIMCPRGKSGNCTITNSVTSIDDYAFAFCTKITSVSLPNTITSIGGLAFLDSGLSKISIPTNVVTIGQCAFDGCVKLTSISIPGSVTNIGDAAFSYCASLTDIEVDASNANYSSVGGVLFDKNQTVLLQCPMQKHGSYSVPTGVTSIGDGAFSECTNLTHITLPDTITNIGYGAFEGCESLAKLTIPDSVATIGSGAFRSCTKLTSVKIPASVTSIGLYIFESCTNLTNITVDPSNPAYSSVNGILFDKNQTVLILCPGGKRGSYSIPEGVATIGSFAFDDCSGLTNILIPDSVTSIGDYAFYCPNLTRITIPASVTNIGNVAFQCENLTNVYFEGNAPAINSPYGGTYVFATRKRPTVYHWRGTSGWDLTFAGAPTAVWQSAPLTIETNGLGTVTAIHDGQMLPIGSTNTITAHPGKGFFFSNWTSNLLPPTNSPTLRFVMQPNLVLTANFASTVRPTLTIVFPKMNDRITNLPIKPSWGDAIWVFGTATEKGGTVTNVSLQLNDGDWFQANGTWPSWDALVLPAPGTNILNACATDSAGQRSVVDTVTFVVVPSGALQLSTTGLGSVSPNYSNAWLQIGSSYDMTATPANGYAFSSWTDGDGQVLTNGPTLQFTMKTNLSLIANFVPTPVSLTITYPAMNEQIPYSAATPSWGEAIWVAGTASANVSNIWFEVNDGGWMAVRYPWAQWDTLVGLAPGTNVLKAYATDSLGNHSATASVTYVYLKTNALRVATTGLGSVSPDYRNSLLHMGKSYSLTATPAKGYLFSNWTSGGFVLTNGPTLQFTMDYSLSFTANFVPNRFPQASGTYSGLFTNIDGATLPGSGFVSATVDSAGALTANIRQGEQTYTFASRFSPDGSFSTNLVGKSNALAISLQLDLNGGGQISGQIAGDSWTAILLANQNSYSKTNPPPQAQAPYTLAMAVNEDSATQPGGYGYGSARIDAKGNVTFTGALADGTSVSSAATLSKNGQWPFYASLYSGNGAIVGWLTLTNSPESDIAGTLTWTKAPHAGDRLYAQGFTNTVEVIGSTYVNTAGLPPLDLTDGLLLLEDGNLSANLINQLTLKPNDTATGPGIKSFSIKNTTGIFTGLVVPSNGKIIKINGAVLQKQETGYGQFIGTNQTGHVKLQ